MSRDPINVLSNDFMAFFTNSDKSLYEYQSHRQDLAKQEILYSKESDTFKAICLSYYDSNSPSAVGRFVSNLFNTFEKQFIKIRFYGEDADRNGPLSIDPLGTDSDGNPLSENLRKALIDDCADTASILDPGLVVNHGDLLEIRQNAEGKYFVVKKVGNINQPTAPAGFSGGFLGGLSRVFSGGNNSAPLSDMGDLGGVLGDITENKPSKDTKKDLNFSFSQYLALSELGVFEPILKEIRSNECSLANCATNNFNGNQYEAFNDGKGVMGNTKLLDKPLDQYTIEQVVALQGRWKKTRVKNKRNKYLLATGGYQIIPSTMASLLGRSIKKQKLTGKGIPGIDTSIIYNKTNQDALGIYLVTKKRPLIGKFLFGLKTGEKALIEAQRQLAFEFASVRVLETTTRKDPNLGIVTVTQYTKAYGGVGTNVTGSPNKARAIRTRTALLETAKLVSNSKEALAILNGADPKNVPPSKVDQLKAKAIQALEEAKKKLQETQVITEELTAKLGRKPTQEEIAEALEANK